MLIKFWIQEMEMSKHRLKLYENCPKYASIEVCNKLPDYYKQLHDRLFKHKVEMFLIKRCYYLQNTWLMICLKSNYSIFMYYDVKILPSLMFLFIFLYMYVIVCLYV